MSISKEILDFLNSSDMEMDYQYKDFQSIKNGKIVKRMYKEDKMLMLYLMPEESEFFQSIMLEYLGSFDPSTKETLDISLSYEILGFNKEEYKEIKDIRYNVLNNLKIDIYKYFEDNKEKLLEKINLAEYEKNAYVAYCNPYHTFEKPKITIKWDDTKDFVYNLNNNKEKTLEELKQQTIESHMQKFIDYYALEITYNEFTNNLLTDTKKQIKSKLCDIFKNTDYKTLKIHYEKSNNKEDIYEFIKSQNKYANIPGQILNQFRVKNVPIYSINKIMHGRKCLYNKDDFKDLVYTNKDLENDYIQLGLYDDLPKSYYKDKNFIKNIVKEDTNNIKLMDNSLKEDKDFLFELLKESPENIQKKLDPKVWDDHNFVTQCLDYLIKNKIDPTTILERTSMSFFDIKNIKKYYPRLNDKKRNIILQKTDDDIINSKEFENIVQPCKWDIDETVINKITNPNTLIKMYGFDTSFSLFNKLNNNLKEDAIFVGYLLDNINPRYYGVLEDITKLYKDDFNILKQIAKFIKIPFEASTFKSLSQINDIDKLLELTSENIYFLEILDSISKIKFLEAEILDFNELNFTGCEITASTPSCKIEMYRYGGPLPALKLIDKYDNEKEILNTDTREHLFNILIEEYNLRHNTEIKDIDELITFIESKSIER